jgi:hypothetical protein
LSGQPVVSGGLGLSPACRAECTGKRPKTAQPAQQADMPKAQIIARAVIGAGDVRDYRNI